MHGRVYITNITDYRKSKNELSPLTCIPKEAELSTPLHSMVASIQLHNSFILSPTASMLLLEKSFILMV